MEETTALLVHSESHQAAEREAAAIAEHLAEDGVYQWVERTGDRFVHTVSDDLVNLDADEILRAFDTWRACDDYRDDAGADELFARFDNLLKRYQARLDRLADQLDRTGLTDLLDAEAVFREPSVSEALLDIGSTRSPPLFDQSRSYIQTVNDLEAALDQTAYTPRASADEYDLYLVSVTYE